MRQADAPPAARIQAIGILLERGWGKAVQPIAGDGENPIRIVVRQIIGEIDENGMKVIDHQPTADPDLIPSFIKGK
jgi:hypothetical protein